MDFQTPHDELVELLRRSGQELAEHRQIAKRFKELLTNHRRNLSSKHLVTSRSQLHAERKALLHPAYQQNIHDILDTNHTVRQLKLQFEIAEMLYNLRVSKNSFMRS